MIPDCTLIPCHCCFSFPQELSGLADLDFGVKHPGRKGGYAGEANIGQKGAQTHLTANGV